jgi:hypothetical protein
MIIESCMFSTTRMLKLLSYSSKPQDPMNAPDWISKIRQIQKVAVQKSPISKVQFRQLSIHDC